MPDTTRIDKWLWAARQFKTRSQATAACNGGKVKLNDASAKPAAKVAPGDVVEVTRGDWFARLKVVAIGERRGPASVAQTLYEDLTPERPPKAVLPPLLRRDKGMGRPTKRDRRRLMKDRDW